MLKSWKRSKGFSAYLWKALPGWGILVRKKSEAIEGGIKSTSRSMCMQLAGGHTWQACSLPGPPWELEAIWEGKVTVGKWSTAYGSHEDKEEKKKPTQLNMDFLLALVVERAWRKHDIEVNFSEVSSSWHFLFLCTMKNIWGKNNLLNFLCRSPIFLFSIVYFSFPS